MAYGGSALFVRVWSKSAIPTLTSRLIIHFWRGGGRCAPSGIEKGGSSYERAVMRLKAKNSF